MFVSVIQYLVLFSVVAKILLIMKQASSPKRQRLDSPDAPKNVKSVYFVMFRPGTLQRAQRPIQVQEILCIGFCINDFKFNIIYEIF